MNVRSAYYFLICSLGLIISVTAKSADFSKNHTSERATETRPTLDRPTEFDLKMYLDILNEREQQLTAANEALLQNANYSFGKIPVFMLKAAIDGYLSARLVGTPSVVTGATRGALTGAGTALSARLLSWLRAGGLDKMKSLGFNIGVLGITMASNSAIQQDYHWQYAVPILGTAYSAYLWSDNLMHTPELIEKNGDNILAIRKEKNRIRKLLEKDSN